MVREIISAAPRIEGCPFVFTTNGTTAISGFSKIKRRLDSMMKIASWRVHDLRRTAVTMMAESGILPHVIEAVVNHVSGHKGGVAGIYNRAQYTAEKKEALERWAAQVENLTLGCGAAKSIRSP
jgi:integrase